MKKAYQIDERKAIIASVVTSTQVQETFRWLLPLADLAKRLRHGVSLVLFTTERDLLMLIMSEEIKWLSQEQGMETLGHGAGMGDHSRAKGANSTTADS